MSGSDIPYQLRPNKFVDREIFIECLNSIKRFSDLSKYAYIGMGGRHLEDFRRIHGVCGITRMLSIENDKSALSRQKFNQPYSFIKCRRMDSGDLVSAFGDIRRELAFENCIIWLDFTSPSDRMAQIREYQSLLSKLHVGDVVRITMNSALSSFGERASGEGHSNYKTRVLGNVRDMLGEYVPENLMHAANMTAAGISSIIAGCVRKAALQGTFHGDGSAIVKPLLLTRYRDGQQMVTATAILLDGASRRKFSRATRMNTWKHFSKDWNGIVEISVPDLSLRERQAIDRSLFDEHHEDAHQKLPFRLDRSESKSLKIYENYSEHYLRYPSFLRVDP